MAFGICDPMGRTFIRCLVIVSVLVFVVVLVVVGASVMMVIVDRIGQL